MNKIAVIFLGFLIVGLAVFGINSYNKINKLEKSNQQLQEKVKSLTNQNKNYQDQLSNQIKEQATKENNKDAESKAVQFVRIYNNTSLAETNRINQLKKLMTSEAFTKKIETNQQQTQESNNIQTRVDIKNVQSFKVEDTQKVTIDYDYIGSVDNTENFVERMNIVVHLVVLDGKWLVNDFEITYKEGPEDHAD